MKYKTALELVAVLFRNEQRLLSGLPYIVHLVGVSYIVGRVTDDEDVIVAALLHDVLEDISPDRYSESDMRRDFGDRITDIVKTVGHDERKYDKELARKKYLEQLTIGPLEAVLVSASDLLHNTTDIVYWYGKDPSKVAEVFGGDKAKLRDWFWEGRYGIISDRLGVDHQLTLELRPKLDELSAIHARIM